MAAGVNEAAGEPLRAVIFDVDGILIDTEPVWRRVETEVFAGLGLHLTEAECRETMGVRIDEVVDLWFARRPWGSVPRRTVVDRIVAGVAEDVRNTGSAIAGAVEAIAAVRRARLACAVASSSPLTLIEAVMAALGITGAVDAMCSAETEAHGKPAPDVYLRAASVLGLPPSSCLAVEDSLNGMLAALAAGMRCVVVPDADTARDARLELATLRLTSMREFDDHLLSRLGAGHFA